MGIILLGYHARAAFGRQKVVNLWLSPRLPGQTIEHYLKGTNQHLAILSALRIARAWEGELNLVTVVASPDYVPPAQEGLEELRDLCRIPYEAHVHVLVGAFEDLLDQTTQADLQVFGLTHERPLSFMATLVQLTRSTCIFVADSGEEDALA